MRLHGDEDDSMESGHLDEFQFDDGGMRGLAAALVWCGVIYFCTTLDDALVRSPGIQALARNLLAIPTYFKRPSEDPAYAMIGRIIRQNVEAKKQAVSSFEWAGILANMVEDGEKITFQQAMDIYNNSPEVAAHGGAKDRDIWRWMI